MKRELKSDYRKIGGKIHISTDNSKPMTEKARKEYEKAILLLFGSEGFEVSVLEEHTNGVMAKFSVKNGIASVEINDDLSKETESSGQ